MKLAIILAAFAVAAFRPYLLVAELGPHANASYQAVAHLLVGGLYGAYLHWRVSFGNGPRDRPTWMLDTANALTAVEVVCAAVKVVAF